MAEQQTSGHITAYVLLNSRLKKPRFAQCSLCCRHNQQATQTRRRTRISCFCKKFRKMK